MLQHQKIDVYLQRRSSRENGFSCPSPGRATSAYFYFFQILNKLHGLKQNKSGSSNQVLFFISRPNSLSIAINIVLISSSSTPKKIILSAFLPSLISCLMVSILSVEVSLKSQVCSSKKTSGYPLGFSSPGLYFNNARYGFPSMKTLSIKLGMFSGSLKTCLPISAKAIQPFSSATIPLRVRSSD